MSLFIVLSSTGIAAMQASTSPRPPRSKGFLAHRIIMSLALLCLICGAVAIVTNKIRIGMRHFYTPHGRLGLTSLILLLIQGSFGIFVTIIPGYKVLYKYHRAVGYIAIFMAWLTACLGLEFRSYSPLLFWAYYAWVAMPVVLVTLYWRMNIRKIFRKPDPIHT
ncbi:MAG: hypothetical protein DHS80DRAFT_14309 [Piptocephalis tieghemiana]|nr:MAG: hypothetical protein DHS80DRAFT_14309 [Piptocephalis tieghemiana]